jgi:hypothetical protein
MLYQLSHVRALHQSVVVRATRLADAVPEANPTNSYQRHSRAVPSAQQPSDQPAEDEPAELPVDGVQRSAAEPQPGFLQPANLTPT